jgi:hypothetical protein
MFTPTHTAITAIRRLVENGGLQPRRVRRPQSPAKTAE